MPKKAIIILELVQESTQTPNQKIEKDIQYDVEIPWCSKINKIEIYNP